MHGTQDDSHHVVPAAAVVSPLAEEDGDNGLTNGDNGLVDVLHIYDPNLLNDIVARHVSERPFRSLEHHVVLWNHFRSSKNEKEELEGSKGKWLERQDMLRRPNEHMLAPTSSWQSSTGKD